MKDDLAWMAAPTETPEAAIATGLPFSLACSSGCDAGDECATLEDALAAGWTWLRVDREGLSWNFPGRCPDCTRADSWQQELFT